MTAPRADLDGAELLTNIVMHTVAPNASVSRRASTGGRGRRTDAHAAERLACQDDDEADDGARAAEVKVVADDVEEWEGDEGEHVEPGDDPVQRDRPESALEGREDDDLDEDCQCAVDRQRGPYAHE